MGLHPSFNHAFRTFLNDAGILAFPSGKAVSPFSSKSEKWVKKEGLKGEEKKPLRRAPLVFPNFGSSHEFSSFRVEELVSLLRLEFIDADPSILSHPGPTKPIISEE